MAAKGKTYATLTFDELSEWEDDSEWEEAQQDIERGGGIKRAKGDSRRRLEKDCPEDCYGECCLNGAWVWLQGSYSDDSARPDLFDEYRKWLHGEKEEEVEEEGSVGGVEEQVVQRTDSGKEIPEKE
jgi:hypothetical protein